MNEKTQNVRLIDVLALGPFMIWYAARTSSTPDWARSAMFVSGVLTILYNGANYIASQRQ